MRLSSSPTSRCGASSGMLFNCRRPVAMATHSPARSGALTPRTVGPRNEPKHTVAVVGINERDQEATRRFVRIGPELGERMRDAGGLQPGELHGQRLAFGGHIEQPLAAIIGAFLLHHIALVDELLEYAPERLLGDLEDV